MKILNIGCGAVRPQGEEWVNLDNLSEQVPDHEFRTIEAEGNYVDHAIEPFGRLPFGDWTFDGILASHFFEHFDVREGLSILAECKRILKLGGLILISVPNTSYFRDVYYHDRNENWPILFETTDPNNPIPTFFEAALFFDQHKMLYTADALWAILTRSGFEATGLRQDDEVILQIQPHLNRRKFSIEMVGYKQ